MKRILLLVALVAAVAASLPNNASAFQTKALSRLHWVKMASSDSGTVITVPFADGDGTTNADTTDWVDISGYNLSGASNGSTTATPLIALQINAQQAATGDSMRITVQWANEKTNRSTNFHAVSAQVAVTNKAPILTILDSDDTVFGTFFRVLFENHDGSTKVSRLVSLVPIVRVAP